MAFDPVQADPFDGDPAHARYWDTTAVRTNTRAYEGIYSLQRFGNNGWFSHDAFPASPGVPLLMQSRFYVESSSYSYSAAVDLASYFLDGSASSEQKTLLAYGSGLTPGWRQPGPTRLTPPAMAGDRAGGLVVAHPLESHGGPGEVADHRAELLPSVLGNRAHPEAAPLHGPGLHRAGRPFFEKAPARERGPARSHGAEPSARRVMHEGQRRVLQLYGTASEVRHSSHRTGREPHG